jgi:hypothetical protein
MHRWARLPVYRWSRLHHFEVRSGYPLQEIQVGIIPEIVGRSADENSAAVISQNQDPYFFIGVRIT